MKQTIRIDELEGHDTLKELTTFLDQPRYTSFLVYREAGELTGKIHYQGVVEFDSDHLGWHKERWSRLFKAYAKGKKSSTIMKKNNYEVYITKDKDRVLCKGYTDDFIKSLEEQSYTKEDTKKKDLYDRFMEYVFNKVKDDEQLKYSRRRIAGLLVDFCGLEKQEVKNFQYYTSLVWNVQCRLCVHAHEKSTLRDRLIERIL